MRFIALALVLFIALVGSAEAQTTTYSTQTVGSFAYTHGSDGSRWTSQQIGPFTYGSRNDGSSSVSQRIGSFDYTTITRPNRPSETWTSQTIGSFRYHNSSKGRSVTEQRIGPFTHFSGDVTGTKQDIGSGYSFWNWDDR